MQTFLPYASFIKSAQCLDNRRLNNQIKEVKQILNALDGTSIGWRNHPATNMWRGHKAHLGLYGYSCCEELERRELKVNSELYRAFTMLLSGLPAPRPPFLGNDSFHHSHQCNLLRKAPIYYSQYFKHPLYALVPYIWWSESRGFYTTK
jgi:hypothetical protein